MKILIVSATLNEIEMTINSFKVATKVNNNFYSVFFSDSEIDFLITGIGSYSTIYQLTKQLSKQKYDLVINAGIAGAFDKKIKLGTVVYVVSEQIADLGVDDNGTFKTIFEQNFTAPNTPPFDNGKLLNNNNLDISFKKATAITTNTVSGNNQNIEKLITKFNADIETMEGAAFFYVCLQEEQKFAEIRAISNYVEARNKNNWEIDKAIKNLNLELQEIIYRLIQKILLPK